MRHHKHRNQLGVKKEHRSALMANLASALIREGRIQTTLKKAKALRPFAERLVTLAKRGTLADRRLAISRVRDPQAVRILFNERVGEFTNRAGGYTRIYKLGLPRRGDAAEMAIIEWVAADDAGYNAGRRRSQPKKQVSVKAGEEQVETAVAVAEAEEEPEAEETALADEPETSDEAPAEEGDKAEG